MEYTIFGVDVKNQHHLDCFDGNVWGHCQSCNGIVSNQGENRTNRLSFSQGGFDLKVLNVGRRYCQCQNTDHPMDRFVVSFGYYRGSYKPRGVLCVFDDEIEIHAYSSTYVKNPVLFTMKFFDKIDIIDNEIYVVE